MSAPVVELWGEQGDLKQAAAWVDALWGERDGHFHFAFGVDGYFDEADKYDFKHWQERSGRWPDDRDRFLEEAITRAPVVDVYVAPYLRSNSSRKKGNALPSSWLYADVDDALEAVKGPSGVLLLGPGGLLIDSGRGRHPYLRLPEELEPGELEQLNRHLARALNADAGWAENKVLRRPGTWNHKGRALAGGVSYPVAALDFRPAIKDWAAHELVAHLGPAPENASDNGASIEPVMPETAPEHLLARLLEAPNEDRSKQCHAFLRACLDAGLSDSEMLAMALRHEPTKAKYGARASTEITRLIRKMRGSNESRPTRDAVGTQTESAPGEKRKTAIASPRPDVVGTRGETQSFSPGVVGVDLHFVSADAFASQDEPGAAALVGDDNNVLVPEGGDVMFYGDGGAGKTTLMVDLALHLAAGDDWLNIRVGRPVRVAIVENEGPRPLFRAKLGRKLRAWNGSPIGDRLLVHEEPWSKVSLDNRAVRATLAAKIAELELDALLVGPVTRSGMNEAGTLQQARDYANLLGEVRAASGRRATFLLAHHENRGGQVSGAWEGAVDTLFHVQAQGNGQTRLFIQKARWSPEHHKQKLQLAWAEGESFDVIEEEERDDNTVADEILQYVLEHGGSGWNKVDEAVEGKGGRLRTIRDNLLESGRLVNLGSSARMKLWNADDPALAGEEPA
jgi:hypothetical protein